MSIGIIGDLHFKESLGYADYVSDKRIKEREDVLTTIVESLKGCEAIVFMGDQLNSRTNHADTLKRFVAFLERFGDKELFLLGGNHDKWADGRCALDFLSEIKGKKWHVIAKEPEVHSILGKRCVFLPYMTGPELKKSYDQSWEDASSDLVQSLPAGDILFAHHAVSGTIPWVMEEVVLDSTDTLKKFSVVIVGHIHESGLFEKGRVLLTGSIFTDTVGEKEKFIWKMSSVGDPLVEPIQLPVRPIVKVENPLKETLATIPKNAIVKALITEKEFDEEELKKHLKRFDGSIIVTQVISERTKNVEDVSLEDIGVEKLLRLYAKAKDINESLIMEGFALLK